MRDVHRLREEAQSLFEDALQHALESDLAVDDLHHPVERLQFMRLRPDLLGARQHEVLEHAVLALELRETEAVDDVAAEVDDEDVGEEGPPAQPPRRHDRKAARHRLA